MRDVIPVTTTRTFDAGPGPGGRIGLLVLGRDPVCELECAEVVGRGDVTLHVARVPDPPDFRAETLATLAGPIAASALSILAGDRLDVIAVACASAVLAIGPEVLEWTLRQHRPSVQVTDPGTAAVAVLRAVGARRLSLLLTTADPVVNQRTVARYEAAGFEIDRAITLSLADDKAMSTLSLQSIAEALAAADDPRSDAILVPCTALRTSLAVGRSRDRDDRPVLTGNRAMIVHAKCMALGAVLPQSLEQLVGR